MSDLEKPSAVENDLSKYSTDELLKALSGRELQTEQMESLKNIISGAEAVDTQQNITNTPIAQDLETNPSEELLSGEYFAKHVETWGMFGYHPPLVVNGIEYQGMSAFHPSGEGQDIVSDGAKKTSSDKFFSISARLSYNMVRLLPEYQGYENKLLVSVVDPHAAIAEKYRGKKIILMNVFHDNSKSPGARAGSERTPTPIAFLVDSKVGEEFQREIHNNPDLIKKFYQKALPGADSQGGENGFKRYNSDEIIFISQEKLNGIDTTTDPNVLSSFLRTCDTIKFKNGSMR